MIEAWSITTIPKTAPQTLHFSFHSVNFGDQFPSPNLDFSWFFLEIRNHFLPGFSTFPFWAFAAWNHRSSYESMPLNSRQVAFCRGFRSQTIWNTRGNENLGTDHPKSDPQTRPEIRRGSGAHFVHSNFILWVTSQHITSETHSQSVFAGQRLPFFKKNACNDENPVICLTPMVPEALVALETDRKIGWHEPAG